MTNRLVNAALAPIRHMMQVKGPRRPVIALRNRGGLGDDIMLSTLIVEYGRRGASCAILTSKPELYTGLPGIFSLHAYDTPALTWGRLFGFDVHDVRYGIEKPDGLSMIPPKQHLLMEMCAQAGLHGEIDLRPYFVLTDEERLDAAEFDGFVAVQSTCLTARFPTPNKDWGTDRMQQFVNALRGSVRFVQLGSNRDFKLEGVVDARGIPFRKSAAVIAQCSLFVGLAGFLMHLARAVDTPSVIIYGGRERPDQSGYGCNINIYSQVSCAPCWRHRDCPGNKICMDMITVGAVVDAVEAALMMSKDPLPLERAILQPCSF